MTKTLYTQKEFRQFDKLTQNLSSHDQMVRINARIAVQQFVAKHGEEKCGAMFEVLKKRDRRRK